MSSHNEDSGARLGNSEIFAVKHTPSDTIPEVGQSPKDDCEIPSIVGREQARYVFDDKNSGQVLSNQLSKSIKKTRLTPFKPSSRPHSRQRDILAGESACPDGANRDGWSGTFFTDVRRARDAGPVLFKDCPAIRVNFALIRNFESLLLEGKIKPSDS